MFFAPEFWSPQNFRSKLKSPFEMAVSAIRAVDGSVDFGFAVANQLHQLGEPLYRKQEPTGYSNRDADWMNSASLLARMNFASALAGNKIPGVKVDSAQFEGEALQIESKILQMEPSADLQSAIKKAFEQRSDLAAGGDTSPTGVVVAGLALGSPDFQRR
jgi:uncharacterized protein (DUF1800 family)